MTSVPPTRASPMPEPGTLFAGRYQLRRKLAAGGMGAVFEARDTETGAAVAIKLVHPELLLEPGIHRRFRRESSILATLDHPSVVRVCDVGTDALGRDYTVMELLEGETLHARFRRPPRVDVPELLSIVSGICGGLGAVHAHGVIHGDIKPANVFLVVGDQGHGPQVKLVDFGLSKVHGLERLTRTGEVIGTPIYMAPELLTGEGQIDQRVDVYALGVVMWEALAGRTPFRERNPGRLLYEIVMGRVEPLRDVRPDVPEVVARCVHRAMATARDARYGSVEQLADELAEARSTR